MQIFVQNVKFVQKNMKKDFYSTSEARKILSDLVNQVKYGNKEIAIGRHGKVEAMLVPVQKTESKPIKKEKPDFHEHIRNIRIEKNKTVKYDSKELEYEYAKLAKKYNLDLIILFGSHASGKVKPDSDVDIAFKGNEPLSFDDEQDLFGELVKLFERDDIDMVNLNTHSDIILLYEIFTAGKVLFQINDWSFSHLRMRSWFDFQDFKRYFKMSKQATLNRVRKIKSI